MTKKGKFTYMNKYLLTFEHDNARGMEPAMEAHPYFNLMVRGWKGRIYWNCVETVCKFYPELNPIAEEYKRQAA